MFDKPKTTYDYDVKEFEKFKQIMIDTGLSADEVAQKMNTKVNPSILGYARATKASEQTQEGLNKYIQTTNQSLGTMAIKSKAAAIGVGALNAVAGMGIGLLASFAIEGVIKLFDIMIETPKEIAEAAQVAKDNIDELTDSLSKTGDLVTNSGKRFAELSQGVNQFTGENNSLSTEEYEEFLELNTQLAEMFPQLSQTYTTNGKAVIQLSGDVDTIVGSLEDLIAKQKELANIEMAENLPDVFQGFQTNLHTYLEEIEKYENDIIDLESQLDAVLSGERTYSTYDHASNDYAGALARAGIDYEIVLNRDEQGNFNETLTYMLPSEDDMRGVVDETINTYKEQISTLEQKIKEENSGLQKYFFAFLSEDWIYSNLTTDMQVMVQRAIGNIDWSKTMHNGKLVSSWEEAEAYIRDTILNGLARLSPEMRSAFSDLFALDISTIPIGQLIDDYNALIEQAIQELGLNEEEALEFRIKFSYVFAYEQDALAKAKNKMGVVLAGTEEEEWLKELDLSELKLLVTLDIDEDTALEDAKEILENAKEELPKFSLVDTEPNIDALDEVQSAYNYQEFGTPNKRATYICEMHKARSLANVYYWNKYYQKNNIDKKFKMNCPKEWALKIISEDEYKMLLDLSE